MPSGARSAPPSKASSPRASSTKCWSSTTTPNQAPARKWPGLPRDIGKLLAYSDECEAVFGTRTTRSLIWSGANMGLLLKWGNWAVAKLVEALFNTSHLSDVGCTYKLLHRSLAQRLLPKLRVGGSHFGPELMLAIITSGARFVEVPVN